MLVALGAGVAEAHSTLDKTSVPGGADVDMALTAQVEVLIGYNEQIVLTVPDGFRVLFCGGVAGFNCTQTTAANPARTIVTWQAITPNQELVAPTERFAFRMRSTAVAGKYKFDIDQVYSTGETVRWNGAEGSANPAAFLTVTGTGVAPVTNTTVATHDSPPATTAPEPFFSEPFTPVPFEDTTNTTVLDATPTTTGSTDTTLGNVAISNTGGGDKGLGGTESVILVVLAALMLSRLRLPKLARRERVLLNVVQGVNVAAAYLFCVLRWLPEYLCILGLSFTVVGLVAGAMHEEPAEAEAATH